MEVIPAIDLLEGRCVRLYQGDYRKETVFSADPVSVARRWEELGARRLHVVDLAGAAAGDLCHLPLIERIAAAVGVPVQVGGGVRNIEALERLLNAGVERAILGTAAVEDLRFVEEACRRFDAAVVVSIDARNGYVATRGWTQGSQTTASALASTMASLGVRRFVYTDIARDGTLTGPNFQAVQELLAHTDRPVIASGGVSSVEHLRRLAGLGVEGAIVGRALYSGELDLREALVAVGELGTEVG